MSDRPIVQKVNERSDPDEVGMSLKPVQKRELMLTLEAKSLDKMRKEATVRLDHPKGSTFSIICDEGAYLEGEDTAPPPLAYYSASIAFCLLTQLSRYAKIARLEIEHMSLRQETRFAMEGSALQGTLTGRGVVVATIVDIKSNEPSEKIAELVRVAQQSCFVHQSIAQPVPTETSIVLNGEPFQRPGD